MRVNLCTAVAAFLLLGTALACRRQDERDTSSPTGEGAATQESAAGKDRGAGGRASPGGRGFTMAGPGPRPKDNSFCLVCHEGLAEELITKVHVEKDVLCVDCHGPSTFHMEDEMLMTEPDIIFGRAEVAAFCRNCHGPHKNPTKVEEFREAMYGRDRANGRVVNFHSICTDCHGTHNIAGRKPGPAVGADEEKGRPWISLFNGKDLTGFKPAGDAKWTVQGGAIVGTQGDDNAPGDLLTEASYKDFLLTVTYRAEWPCNSGVWFRYQSAQQAYQADVLEWPDPVCYSGTLYCTGKMFLAMNTNKDLVDREAWNTISVRAQGDHIQVWLNGHQVADVHDDTSDTGRIGFQVHPGEQFGPMKIVVRELLIKEL